jgi:hypothetical protein
MRTKTLLLTAALSAAGVATSMAQGAVYSVNAVGYVNTSLVAGYNLISNPLDNKSANGNSIANLFAGVPDGTQVFKFENGAFVSTAFDEIVGGWDPADVAAKTVLPGDGVFVRVNGPTTITFVGEVPQGNLVNPLPAGLSIKSSMVPQAGTAADLGLQGADGDQLYQWVPANQAYATSTFDSIVGGWDPALGQLKVGEAFFLRKAAAGTWNRTFSVNQ